MKKHFPKWVMTVLMEQYWAWHGTSRECPVVTGSRPGTLASGHSRPFHCVTEALNLTSRAPVTWPTELCLAGDLEAEPIDLAVLEFVEQSLLLFGVNMLRQLKVLLLAWNKMTGYCTRVCTVCSLYAVTIKSMKWCFAIVLMGYQVNNHHEWTFVSLSMVQREFLELFCFAWKPF